MGGFKRKVTRAIVVLALVLLGAMVPAVQMAEAAPAPWTWKRVTQGVSVQATTSYAIRALCPSGYTAITGGLQLPLFSTIVTLGQYRQDDASGSGWSVIFRNHSTSTGTATVVAECVETVDLPPMSYQLLEFAADGDGVVDASVPCPNPGDLVLTGGTDWNNTSSSRIVYSSAPAWSAEAWSGYGRSTVAGAKLGIEVYCVNPADVPGYERVEATPSSGWSESSVTCPVGKRILNGGVDDFSYGSYPNLTKWTSTSSATRTIRAMCVDAGTPTVAITGASFGSDGAITRDEYVGFGFTGSDPAGFPNSFQCSLNGSPLAGCSSTPSYGPLTTGPYELVVRNATADGRSSNLVSYHWTVDVTRPTVTRPQLPTVTLAKSVQATWTGSDQHSGIDHYQAKYWLAHADGTTTGWTQQPGWSSLASPSVRTPDLAQGDSVCLSVRAHDGVGNRSRWTAPRCTSRPLDDRALTASTGWTRATGSSYWLNTITRTTASTQTLRRTGVQLSRVGVVATVCSGCGLVDVKVGTSTIGSINLAAAALGQKRVLMLPAFTERTGTVTVRSVSSGKQIAIDGLVVIRTTNQRPA